MSNDKPKVTDKASEIAKNIWLAGVGAYGKAIDEAQDRLEKAGVETPRLFKDLVEAGAALEEEAQESLGAARSARSSVEERIARVRENFQMQRTARGGDVAKLNDKIDALATKLDQLTEALAAQGILPDPAATKAGTKKTKPKARASTKRKTKPATKAKAKKAPAKRKASPSKKPVAKKSKA